MKRMPLGSFLQSRPRSALSAQLPRSCAFAAVVALVVFPAAAYAQAKGSNAPAPAASASPSSASFESQMLTYGAVDKISAALATKICSLNGVNEDNGTIVIYDQSAFASLQAYAAFKANAKIVFANYLSLIPPDARGAAVEEAEGEPKPKAEHVNPFAALALTADPFADFTGLLNAIAVSANVQTPGQVTVPDSNLAVALTRDIEKSCDNHNFSIVYPPIFGVGSSSQMESADIQGNIVLVDSIRSQAIAAVRKSNLEFINNYSSTQTTRSNQTTRANPKTPPAPKVKGDEDLKKTQVQETSTVVDGANTIAGDPILTAAFTDVNGLYDTLMNSLLGINAATGTSGSTAAIQGELLARTLCGEAKEGSQPCEDLNGLKKSNGGAGGADPYEHWARRPAFVVLASVANAGGTLLDHKTFWTALSSGDVITYSGGAIVNAAIWSVDLGRPLYANVLRYRVPFSAVGDPGDSIGAKAGRSVP